MSNLDIGLKIRPLTYNQYFRNNKKGWRIKTGAGLAYDEELDMLLKIHAIALSEFGEGFDPSNYIVGLNIIHYNPQFYLKDGSRMSKTAGDIDGPVKVLQDKLFELMGLDDYLVKSMNLRQYPGTEDIVHISLEQIDLSAPEYQATR